MLHHLHRWLKAVLALVVVALLVPLLLSQAPATPKRYAVLVGIDEYANKKLPRLNYAGRDVVALADLLREGGYEVVVLTSEGKNDRAPTRANIDRELTATLKKVPQGGQVVVAFAGHGVQFEGDDDSFFCPSDAVPFPDEKATLLSMKSVYARLEKCNGAGVLLVDACRNDPDVRGARRGVNPGTTVPEGVAALFSCKASEFAYESAERKHGIFFYHVLDRLRRARDTGEEVTFNLLADHVQKVVPEEVQAKYQGKQSPSQKSNLTERFVVLAPSTRVMVEAKPLKAPFGEKEIATARAAWSKKLGVPEKKTLDLGGGVTLDLVLIPPGVFQMGSPETEKDRYENEKQHEVELTQAFYMAVTETTQAQYKAVTGESPSHFKGDTLPVETVSWNDAVSFCEKLDKKVGAKVSLPTEAQWEYACRAGTKSVFHFGDVLNGDKANCAGNLPYGTETKGPSLEKTTPAGDVRYLTNGFGLRDMHGNVWEWCLDGYKKEYEGPARINPLADQQKEGRRVLRGGSWGNFARYCRAAFRFDFAPENRRSDDGFRVVVLP